MSPLHSSGSAAAACSVTATVRQANPADGSMPSPACGAGKGEGRHHCMQQPIFTEDHDLIRRQLRRFVDEEVRPHGPKWEEAGFVPRAVLRRMGGLGFFSLRVPEALGGAGLDARASVVLAEEVGRST